MIRIQIVSTPEFHPHDLATPSVSIRQTRGDTSQQHAIAKLGHMLPRLFDESADKLHLPSGTTRGNIRVSHKRTHSSDVNSPSIEFEIHFPQAYLDQITQCAIVEEVKRLILAWFQDHNAVFPKTPNFAICCIWGGHGYLDCGDEAGIAW